jgi:large subunit ribosomal protein L40e
MQIFVQVLPERTITLEVNSSDTIDMVKSMIQEMEHIPPGQQHLKFSEFPDGKPFEGGCTLSDYNIQNASTLLLQVRQGGRVKDAAPRATGNQMSCVSPDDDRMMAGTASNLAAAKRLALQSGVTEGQWERMHDELRRHWVSLATAAKGASSLATRKQINLSEGLVREVTCLPQDARANALPDSYPLLTPAECEKKGVRTRTHIHDTHKERGLTAEVGGVQNSLEILHRMMAGSGEAHHQTGVPPFAEFAPGPQDGDSNLSAALEDEEVWRAFVSLSLSLSVSL